MRVLSALFTFILSSSIASGFPVDQGSEDSLPAFNTPIPTITTTMRSIGTTTYTSFEHKASDYNSYEFNKADHNTAGGQKNNSIGFSAPQENTISGESEFFATLKGYVDGEKFLYEKYLQDLYKLNTQWQRSGAHAHQNYVSSVLGDMTDAAKGIVRLITHENQDVSSVIRNMYHFYVNLLFSYKADKTVDGDVSSEAFKQKISNLWDTFKEVRALPRGPLWDLRNENVELDIKISVLIRDLERRIPR